MVSEEIGELMEADMPPYEWYNMTDYAANYSFILPFENNWDRYAVFPWYRRNGKRLAYWACLLYLLLIWTLQRVMSHRQHGFHLRLPLTLFNFALAMFSAVGFARTLPELIRSIRHDGLEGSVCVSHFMQDQVAVTWIRFFGWSKYVELVDTLFLILRKKPVSFLHWYHHASVLVFTWHGMHTYCAAGRWFSNMNYAVHSVMYSYFAWRSLGFGCPRYVPMCITILQLSQMVAGCLLGYTIYRVKSSGAQCHHPWNNLYLAFFIYSSYLYLFARYFYFAYLQSSTLPNIVSSLPCCVDNALIHQPHYISKTEDELEYSNVKKRKQSTRSQNGIIPPPNEYPKKRD